MATRTMKLMGKAYSTEGNVSVLVTFNNETVVNGTVSTVNATVPEGRDAEPVELASWTIDTSLTGSVPLTIQVNNGTLDFTNLYGNYSGYVFKETNGERDIVDGEYVILTEPVDYFGDVNQNSIESDGKNNATLSVDNEQRRELLDNTKVGDWTWRIDDGDTFSCDFAIDPDLLILTAPVYTGPSA